MAKRSGLGGRLAVRGYDLSGDIGQIGRIGGGPSLLEVTGIDKSGHERVGGRIDASIEFTSYFNPADDQAHPVLSALPTADVHVMYASGNTIGESSAALVAKQIDYAGERADDGGFTLQIQTQSNGSGLTWGKLLTAWPHTATGAETLASVDFGADAPGFFDASAYLQVFSFTGTDATVTVQTSTDDGAGDPFAARVAFDQITTGPQAQRKTQTTPASELMERYARVVVTTSGGFSELVFAVMLNPNWTEIIT